MEQEAEREAVLRRIREERLVAIVRAASAGAALERALAWAEAGLGVIEVSFNTPEADAVLAELARRHPRLLVGAGTVLEAAQAEKAVAAGARFLLSPVFTPAVLETARAAGVLYVPGVMTPGELAAVLAAGLRLVKLFPAGALGPAGLKALREPFPGVDFLPTGGVAPEAAPAWFEAGALALGLGGALARAGDVRAAAQAVRSAAEAVQAAEAARAQAGPGAAASPGVRGE